MFPIDNARVLILYDFPGTFVSERVQDQDGQCEGKNINRFWFECGPEFIHFKMFGYVLRCRGGLE